MAGFSFRDFPRAQGGAVSVFGALSLLLLLTVAAIVIDAGAL